MNDFDTLLPHRRPAPPLPDRGGPAAVVRAAAARRRRRACAASGVAGSLTAAVVLLAAVLPEPPRHGVTVSPDASPTAAPATRVATRAPSAPRPLATVPPSGPPRATRPPGPPPAPVPTVVASAPATPTRSAEPSPEPFYTYTRVERSIVPDDPTQTCWYESADHDGPQLVCVRVAAPESVPSGAPAVLTTHVCARNGDVTLRFAGDTETVVQIYEADSASARYESRVRPTGVGAHEVVVRDTYCLRHDFHWDGNDDRGRPLPPGDYRVSADVDASEPVSVFQRAEMEVTPAESPGGDAP